MSKTEIKHTDFMVRDRTAYCVSHRRALLFELQEVERELKALYPCLSELDAIRKQQESDDA